MHSHHSLKLNIMDATCASARTWYSVSGSLKSSTVKPGRFRILTGIGDSRKGRVVASALNQAKRVA